LGEGAGVGGRELDLETAMTRERYLELERKAEYKSEYYRGEMLAMAGAKEAHKLLAGNLFGELHRNFGPVPAASTRVTCACA
jgi:hypothetical protein